MNIKPTFSSSEVVFKIIVKNKNSHSTVNESNNEKENIPSTNQNQQHTPTTENEAVANVNLPNATATQSVQVSF